MLKRVKVSGQDGCKYKITRRCVIKKKTEELSKKPLRRPLSGNRSTR